MTHNPLLDEWLKEIRKLNLLVSDSGDVEARANSVEFRIQDAQNADITPDRLADFLLKCFREYSRLAAEKQTRGLFYSWHDEMAGEVRCSFSSSTEAENLPFQCKIEPCGDLEAYAREMLESPAAAGIPYHELSVVDDWPEDIHSDDEIFVLKVFVRRTVGVEA